MLIASYEGWFQCRLARDPDPADEPRGVSGASFALVNEDDLDRVIRLHNPKHPRTLPKQQKKCGAVPEVGVCVTSVSINDKEVSDHILVGASMELLDDPKFEGRNNAALREGAEPIHPFHLSISRNNTVLLKREDLLNPENTELGILSLPRNSPYLRRRMPVALELNSEEVRKSTGITNPSEYLEHRRELLKAARADEGDEIKQIALKQRIDGLTFPDEDTFLFAAQIEPPPALATLRRLLHKHAKILLSQQVRFDEEKLLIKDLETGRSFEARPGRNNVVRIFELKNDWRSDVLQMTLGARMIWEFEMNGPNPFIHESLLYQLDGGAHWPIRFWMGAWDNDALCGYMKGTLFVPGSPHTPPT